MSGLGFGDSEAGTGFASVLGTFGKLTELQSRIGKALEQSRVPWSETRKFLAGCTVEETASTPLAQFLTDLFKEVGLGKLELVNIDDFSYTFRTYECPICSLYPDVKDRKVCNPTVEALQKFFDTDLDLVNASEETHCKNAGHEYCQFTVDVRRLSVYMIILDRVNIQILRESFGSSVDEELLQKRLNLSEADITERLNRLIDLNIFDDSLRLTDSGEAFRQYILGNPPTKEEEFDPPWQAMSEISTSIAATRSFAEALVEISDDGVMPWEEESGDAAAVKEEAGSKSGFGELLSGLMKKDDGKKDKKGEEEEEEEK